MQPMQKSQGTKVLGFYGSRAFTYIYSYKHYARVCTQVKYKPACVLLNTAHERGCSKQHLSQSTGSALTLEQPIQW